MRRWPRWPRSEPGPRRPDCRGLSYRYRRPRAPWGPVPAARTRGAFPRPRCAPSGRAVLDFLSLQGNELVGRVELIELRAKVERVDPGVVFRQHKVVGLSQKDVPSGDDLLFQCGGSDPKLLRGPADDRAGFEQNHPIVGRDIVRMNLYKVARYFPSNKAHRAKPADFVLSANSYWQRAGVTSPVRARCRFGRSQCSSYMRMLLKGGTLFRHTMRRTIPLSGSSLS
jgi:hypothetical protein